MTRVKELDYLRGFAAISIMLYHFYKWLYIYDGAQTILGRLSVYGVEIFYVLSGITLFHVYHNNISDKITLMKYFIKRFFRIFPLFWLSIFIALAVGLKHTTLYNLFLNASGLFSMIAWEKYIAPGTWSIGNELVFYLLFPLILFVYRFHYILYLLLGICLTVIHHYFAFTVFNPNDTLHNQWTNFVNPLNHLFLFYAGMSIPMILKNHYKKNIIAFAVICFGVLLLFLYPSGTDGIHLLFGIKRWIFTLASIMICVGFYISEMKLPEQINRILKHMGEISYGIYLLHPFVYQFICMFIRKLMQTGIQIPPSNYLLISVSVLLTLFVSDKVYRYFELFFIKKGNEIASNSCKS